MSANQKEYNRPRTHSSLVARHSALGVNRRYFFQQFGSGLLGAAIGYLWKDDGLLTTALASETEAGSGGRIEPRLPIKAKSVIMLFMCGGVSHIDTFDPKDNQHAGKLIDAVGFGDNQAKMQRPVIPILRTYTRYGKSGIPVSDWFPHVGGCVDDIAVIRSLYTEEVNHFPAVIEMITGHRGRQFNHPSLGGWISYALGTANKNLPAFINIGRPSSPVQLTGGYLGTTEAATPFGVGEVPVENLKIPQSISPAQRERDMELLYRLNSELRRQYDTEMEIAARLKSYELAARMQLSVPEIVDLNQEPEHVRELYGIGEKETDSFGRQLLFARRLSERGVRFIQICHGGGGNGDWDAHGDMKSHEPLCRQTDKPISGLLKDLKQRSLLDSTLVVWTTEFGRTPWSQNTTGRDHNPRGFCSWMAGGGIKKGVIHGSTDDVGFHAVEDRAYVSDLLATILHQMGLHHEDLTTVVNNRPVRLVEPGHGPITKIIA
ncbi:MAG TPA: DUF1501 domain-containing protein [Terriglobia bacterium]|nr:DUF1501 domain-containing protein [Terriglobia bacterium]